MIKILIFLSLLALTTAIYAATTTITFQYPTPQGNYNELVFGSLTAAPDCSTNPQYADLIYKNPTSNYIETCASNSATAVTYGEKCFNRFSANSGLGCPAGFTATSIDDSFYISTNSYPIHSTVCCSGSTVGQGV